MSGINICITKLPRDQHSISKFHAKWLKCWQQPPHISHVSLNTVFLWNPRIYWFVFLSYDCKSLYRGEGIHQKQWILCILFWSKKPSQNLASLSHAYINIAFGRNNMPVWFFFSCEANRDLLAMDLQNDVNFFLHFTLEICKLIIRSTVWMDVMGWFMTGLCLFWAPI